MLLPGTMAHAEFEGKYFLSYEHIHAAVQSLAQRIQSSGFEADLIVAIGSGGFIPARILRTYLRKPILTVGITYYGPDDKPSPTPHAIQWIDEVEKKLAGKKVLLVDEVDDSRVTLEYCLNELLRHGPAEIAVAVLHNKKKEKRGRIPSPVKRYFAAEELDDKWICYPWDAVDIADHERIARSGLPAR
jgi:hypoxanthine phosphoribosyltransferase